MGARQSIRRGKSAVTPPVIAVQTVIRADPQEAGTVLQQGLNTQVWQTCTLVVALKAITLPVQPGRQQEQTDQRNYSSSCHPTSLIGSRSARLTRTCWPRKWAPSGVRGTKPARPWRASGSSVGPPLDRPAIDLNS